MELKWLEDFVELAASGSFSKAASLRHVTQPAFSRRIRALEHWVGVPLVDRSSYPTRLTVAGERFRKVAIAASGDLSRARADLRLEASALDPAVRFAALHTLALVFFPRWWSSLSLKLGALRTSLVADNLHDCVEMLTAGSCDFLLCYADPRDTTGGDLSRFKSVVLSTDQLVPVVPARNGQPAFSIESHSPTPYLRYSAGTILGKLVEGILAGVENVRLVVRYENSMADALKAMVLEGAGMAWLPLNSVRREIERGEVCIAGPTEWQLQMEVRLYRPAEPMRHDCELVWCAAVAEQLAAQAVVSQPG